LLYKKRTGKDSDFRDTISILSMEEREQEYDIFDTVEITSYYTDKKIRGFLYSDAYIHSFFKNDVNNFCYHNVNVCGMNRKGEVVSICIEGRCKILLCRMVLFEKFIFDDDKIIQIQGIKKIRRRRRVNQIL
jgi:hypothetical protein